MISKVADTTPAGTPPARSPRGQTTTDSLITLAVLLIAAIGAVTLYGGPMLNTTQKLFTAMFGAQSAPAQPPPPPGQPNPGP